jgi:transcriptional regulator with XRE-family HTH domain
MNEGNNFRFDLWLYNEIKRRGLNISEFADRAGISSDAVSDYLKNKRLPNMVTLALILKALKMHLIFEDD